MFLKNVKNSFVNIITQKGFNPKQFMAFEEERDSCPAFVIRYQNTQLEFWIRHSSDNFRVYDCNYTNFASTIVGYFPKSSWAKIEDTWECFEKWLMDDVSAYLIEQDEPDLWSQLRSETVLEATLLDEKSKEMFSLDEKTSLKNAISSFRLQVIENYNPNVRQLTEINDKLDYLAIAVDRLNKFDWQSLLLTIVIGVATTLCVDTNTGRALYKLAQQTFPVISMLNP